MDNEYEDSIDKFKRNMNGPGGTGGPNGPNGPGGPGGPGGPNQQSNLSPEQQQAMKQQAMQQQAMQQQAMQQQAMQQQAMQQQMMQQQMMQQQKQPQNYKDKSLLSKLKQLKKNETLQEIFILAILFIIFSTSFFKNNLSKIPFVSVDNNNLNTAGLLISALMISIIFILIKLFL
jgi:hypothetical protein